MRPRTRSVVQVGCSGWNYRSWRDELYPRGLPARDWLTTYAEHFGTVEVNTTFYRLVSREAVQRWVAQTPDGFTFAVKASRYLTHVRRLRDIADGFARLCERIEPLVEANRLGPMLWQLPENFHRDDRRLDDALAHLPGRIRHAFEFRHDSWFVPQTYRLLSEHGAALVVADGPGRLCETAGPRVGWRYLRMHHGRRGRRGNYSDRELEDWVRRLEAWRRTDDIYVYFNNDWEAFAPRNALTMKRQLDGDRADAPAGAGGGRRAPTGARRRPVRQRSRRARQGGSRHPSGAARATGEP